MTIEVELPAPLLERLTRAAEATGSDVPTLVRQAVETAFAPMTPEEAPPPQLDQWIAELRAWAAQQPRRDYIVDDSRESIYGDER